MLSLFYFQNKHEKEGEAVITASFLLQILPDRKVVKWRVMKT